MLHLQDDVQKKLEREATLTEMRKSRHASVKRKVNTYVNCTFSKFKIIFLPMC